MKTKHQFQAIAFTMTGLTEELRKQLQKQQQVDKINSKYDINNSHNITTVTQH